MKSIKTKISTLLAVLLLPMYGFAQEEVGLDQRIDQAFAPIADWWEGFVLTPIPFSDTLSIPLVLILLVAGALFFTIYFAFPSITKFPLAINTVRGKYDSIDHHGADPKAAVNIADGDVVDTIADESKEGEVSHFQALATAVSGTVGLGNIAGVVSEVNSSNLGRYVLLKASYSLSAFSPKSMVHIGR